MLIKMKVSGLTIDPLTNTPIVILKDMQEKRSEERRVGKEC